jgi:hypothetical protein
MLIVRVAMVAEVPSARNDQVFPGISRLPTR